MNYVTTIPKTVITAQEHENRGWSFFDEATFETSDYYMFMFYFLTFLRILDVHF